MKVYNIIYLNETKTIDKMKHLFPDLFEKIKVKNDGLFIPEGNDVYHQLKEYLDSINYSYTLNGMAEFSTQEYRDAQLLNVAGKVINDWGDKYGTEYEIIAGCDEPTCRKIEVQKSILHLDTTKLGKSDIGMLYSFESVVSKRFKDLVLEHGLTGCSFEPVIHKKKGVSEDVFQLKVNKILPNVAPEFKREIVKCKKCNTEILLQKDWQFVYSTRVLDKACDFNITKEFFSMAFPFHELIVSQKVYQLFKQHNLKGATFVPVKLI